MIEAEGSKADNTEHIHDENEKQWEAYLLLLRRRAKNKSNSKGSPLVRGRAGRRTGTRVLMSPTTRQRQRPRPGPAAPASPSLRQAPAPVPFHTPPSFLPSPSVLSRLQTPSTPVGTREDAATATCRQTSAPASGIRTPLRRSYVTPAISSAQVGAFLSAPRQVRSLPSFHGGSVSFHPILSEGEWSILR